EDLRLPPAPGAAPPPPAAAPEPFPPWEEEAKLAREVLPAWMGINFRPAGANTRARYQLAEGATSVITVYPDSPAQAAGLQVGDIILGPPGKPFIEPHQVREWTMLSPAGRPAPLQVRRGEREVGVTPVPKPYPGPFPATVALDELRRTFQAYGVSGTPTFVLVGAEGRVESTSTGYTAEKGLGIEGWSWSKRAAR